MLINRTTRRGVILFLPLRAAVVTEDQTSARRLSRFYFIGNVRARPLTCLIYPVITKLQYVLKNTRKYMYIKYKILYINKDLFIRILKLELVKYEEYVKNTQD